MKRMLLLGLAVAGISAAQSLSPTMAATQGWSTASGLSLGWGGTIFEARLGFPDVSIGVAHGFTRSLDAGARLSFLYSYQDLITTLAPAVGGELYVRWEWIRADAFSLGLHGGLGCYGYLPSDHRVLLFTLPLGLTLGLPISSAVLLQGTLDVPFGFSFGPSGGVTVPLLAGGGVEYFVSRQFELNASAKMGPELNPIGYWPTAVRPQIAFEARVGLAYRF